MQEIAPNFKQLDWNIKVEKETLINLTVKYEFS